MILGGVSRSGCSGVDVRPFRAWVLMPERLRGLADRHATPWDQLEGGRSGSVTRAMDVLDEWMRNRVVTEEPGSAWYAYEQSGPRGSQRGLISAVHLDSRLLPHEDVIPAQIGEMADLMRATDMNLPPVLLGYSGDGRTSAHLAQVTRQPPLALLRTTDGQEHRVWRVAGAEARADITDELATRAAFVADGHHRHAAARHLRRKIYAEGYGTGAWDYLLGLLVDVKYSPPQLRPIHRVLPHVDPRRALGAAAEWFRITSLSGPLEEWLDVLRARAYRGPAFVVVTRQDAFLLSDPDPRFLGSALERRPEPLRKLHITVLHALIGGAWSVPDTPDHIHYETSAATAVEQVRERGGLAALVTPPTQRDLQAAVAAGVRLPCKTTFFGPKPHPGLLLRALNTPAPEEDVHYG